MFKNYLTIAWRTLRRHATYTIVNSVGLALGFAVALLVLLFVWDEWQHDAFHEQGDHLYRVVGQYTEEGGSTGRTPETDGPLAPLVEQHVPAVDRTVRLSQRPLRTKQGGVWTEQTTLFADSTFFDTFTFPLAHGHPATALDRPDGVVVSTATAQRLFDAANPMGRSLPVEFRDTVRVLEITGVLEPVPQTSSLQFDLLMPLETMRYDVHPMVRDQILNRWRRRAVETYVHLAPGTTPDSVAAGIERTVEQHGGDIPTAYTNVPKLDAYSLQPLSDVYFSPDLQSDVAASSNPVYSVVLLGIAALVLLLACINFAILAIGRSAQRAPEVGIRKVVGARRGQIQRQFLSEAFLITLVALGLGAMLATALLPAFNAMADRALTFAVFPVPVWIGIGIALAAVVSLLAGGYPSWILTRFDPVQVVQGWGDRGHSNQTLIRGLVVVQFTLSIALLAVALVMMQQLRYVQRTDLGFDEEQVVVIENQSPIDDWTLLNRLRSRLASHSAIEVISGMNQRYGTAGSTFNASPSDSATVAVGMQAVEKNFTDVLGVDVVAGRPLSETSVEARPPPVLVNRAFVRALGWTPQASLGQVLHLRAGNIRLTDMKIVGVADDYHYQSLHHAVEPMVLVPAASMMMSLPYVAVRTAPDRTQEALDQIRAAWNEMAPAEPFTHRFLDDAVQTQYEADRRWATMVRYAVGIALLIACFGLFGLSALAAERRTKEIGIRKALGATARQIVMLLSREFVVLVGLALVVAVPVAYVGARRWLQDFAYRIDLGPWVFLLAGALTLGIALLTVSTHALRAAHTDPATTLRDE
jgi:putative ABC transport system permease protein